METTKPKISTKTIVLPIIGLIAFFLYILIFNVNIAEIIATAQRANPLIYSVAILMGMAEIFFYALSWRMLLSSIKINLSLAKACLFVWYGVFMDILIPAESVSGELCRVYLVNREQNGSSGKVVASVVTQRLLGMAINVIVLCIAIGVIFTDPQSLIFNNVQNKTIILNLIGFTTIAVTAILVALIVLSFKEKWSLKILNGLLRIGDYITRGKWNFNRIKEEAVRSIALFHVSMKDFKRERKAISGSLFVLILNWVSSLSIPYFVFMSLGTPVSWSVIVITSTIVIAVKSIPVGVPFEVGLPEITMTTLYIGLNVPAGIAATATILTRIVTLWLRFGIGFACQQWVELTPVFSASNNGNERKKSKSLFPFHNKRQKDASKN